MAKKKQGSQDKPAKSEEKIEVKTASTINDVAKPGETAASPTSRPVITGHGPMIKQDPMVSGGDDKNEAEAEKKEENIAKKNEVKLEPVAEDTKSEKAEEPKTETQEDKPSEPSGDKAENVDDNSDKNTGEKKDDSSTSDSAAINSLATSAESKALSSKEAEAEQAQRDKVKELINSKKYSVSITEGGHKATSQRLATWLLLLLLISSIGVYLAIDAGYLEVGVELPYDLIKN